MSNPTTVSANLERTTYGGSSGSIQLGQHRQVIGEAVATRTLTAAESGSLCLLDRAAGVVYTLPAPVVGMYFDFMVTVAVTSNAHKVITNAATVYMVGKVLAGDITIATSGDVFTADGTSIVAISAAGSVTGGLVGESYRLTCISTTKWAIEGVTHGAGTLTTPFATS